jgi:hypothetical protein
VSPTGGSPKRGHRRGPMRLGGAPVLAVMLGIAGCGLLLGVGGARGSGAVRRPGDQDGGPAATPTPTPTPSPTDEPLPPSARTASVPDLDKLRSEYDRLREELFKARVRSQKVAEAVYPTRFDLRLRWKGGPEFVIRKARFLLDGAEIWDSADKTEAEDLIEIAARPIQPGPHALTVSLEVRPRAESKGGTKVGLARLGYTSDHTFAIAAPDQGTVHLRLTGDEDGNPPEYEPRLELEVKTSE